MTFSVFVPPHADGATLPVVWYLSGLTCTHANVTEKGDCRAACADLFRLQPGYVHSYYFVSTFMEDHLRWHAARLG